MLLYKVNELLKYVFVAAGNSTVPPPAATAALMAFVMAVVLSVFPSPTAPKLVTLKLPAGMVGNVGLTAWARTQPAKTSEAKMKATPRFMNVIPDCKQDKNCIL